MKKKSIPYDEYFSNGAIELGRIGNVVSVKNNLSEKDIRMNNELLANEYDNKKSEIDVLIRKICTDISKCNPLQLLEAAISEGMFSLLNIFSESQLGIEQCYKLRAVEYIQSILISEQSEYNEGIEEQDKMIETVLSEVDSLFQLVQFFYIYWGAKASQESILSKDDIEYIVEAQLMGNVRGKRYQFQQLENIKALLLPHTEKMQEIYGITAYELIAGLQKLEYSLSSGKIDSMKELYSQFLQFQEEAKEKSIGEVAGLLDQIRDSKENLECCKKSFGLELYNVKNVTNWSDKFIDSLSWELGESIEFLSDANFSGWPVIDLPVQKRPFIKIDGISYCFDYYNLFDNIYRIIQKDIKRHDNRYTTTWSNLQQEASEELVRNLFDRLLPGSKSFVGNYYPVNQSLKQMDENDLLLLYDDTIIIAEVKAGSFTYTPAITDFEAHKNSFNALIGKADYQCERTLSYVKSNEKITFYDKKQNEKVSIDRKRYKNFYTFCVTVDNFNAFEAKIEKMNFLKIDSGTIAISIDDLEVYEKYFDSPLYFLHFLKHRKASTRLEKLMLNDELDHLGMYIVHNVYPMYVNEFDECTAFTTNGYREDLDAYFATLHLSEIEQEKPVQDIPVEIREIVCFTESNTMDSRVSFTSFLLDLAPETKQQFAETIQHLLQRQKEINMMIPTIASGDVTYGYFVIQDGVDVVSEDDRLKYMYANMLKMNKDKSWYVALTYDTMKILKDVEYKELYLIDIENKGYHRDELLKYAEILYQNRVKTILEKEHKKKIYPNDMCPCGSGKKYKKCCGKK